jgi:hypothetical protein
MIEVTVTWYVPLPLEEEDISLTPQAQRCTPKKRISRAWMYIL